MDLQAACGATVYVTDVYNQGAYALPQPPASPTPQASTTSAPAPTQSPTTQPPTTSSPSTDHDVADRLGQQFRGDQRRRR